MLAIIGLLNFDTFLLEFEKDWKWSEQRNVSCRKLSWFLSFCLCVTLYNFTKLMLNLLNNS